MKRGENTDGKLKLQLFSLFLQLMLDSNTNGILT